MWQYSFWKMRKFIYQIGCRYFILYAILTSATLGTALMKDIETITLSHLCLVIFVTGVWGTSEIEYIACSLSRNEYITKRSPLWRFREAKKEFRWLKVALKNNFGASLTFSILEASILMIYTPFLYLRE